jgi:hypothetical protein
MTPFATWRAMAPVMAAIVVTAVVAVAAVIPMVLGGSRRYPERQCRRCGGEKERAHDRLL